MSKNHDKPATATGTGIDVGQLSGQDLPESPFPRGGSQDFRVSLTPDVHKEIWKHATEDTSVEICGVLVGSWAKDADGAFVQVTNSIRGEAAQNKFAEVTFTHDTWARINSEMDKNYADRAIVGWYHTHPDFGIFLSDRDRFIQEHFFSGAGQVALVVDPIRKTEGVFVWRSGKASMCPYFWVGNQIVLGTAAGDEVAMPSMSRSDRHDSSSSRPAVSEPPAEPSMLSGLTKMLSYLCLFLLGFLLSGLRSSWEQAMVTEGVLAHFGLWQAIKPGLHENLSKVDSELGLIARRLNLIASDQVKRLAASKDKDAAEQLEQWKQVLTDLPQISSLVRQIDQRYSPTPEEAAAIERVVMQSLQNLNNPRSTSADSSADKPAKSSSESPSKSKEEKASKAAGEKSANTPLEPAPDTPKTSSSKSAPSPKK